jgi:hypothetical protein
VRSLLVVCLGLIGCTFDTRGISGATGDGPKAQPERGREGLSQGDIPVVADSPTDLAFAPPVDAELSLEVGLFDAKPKPDAKPLADLKPAADTKPSPDVKPKPDLRPPDLKPPPDLGFKPVGTVDLLAVWAALQVPCVGGPSGSSSIKPLDNLGYAAIVNGTITLAGAPADTKAWAGTKPCVTVIFDPNACGQEDPINGDGDWGSAGILIRGATLTGGMLLLAAGTGTGDMDFLDVTGSGAFEGGSDFAKPDDSQLASYPQLVGTVNALKQGILKAAAP